MNDQFHSFDHDEFTNGFQVQQVESLRSESQQHVRRDQSTVALEGYAADAYQSACEDAQVTPEQLCDALTTIAAAFYNPSANVDEEGRAYNATWFQQRGALSNICQNASWMLENEEKRLVDMFTRLDQQEATFDDTEIARRNLDQTVSEIERIKETRVPMCREWLRIAKAAYRGIMGEEWRPYTKKGKSPQQQSNDALRARIEKARKG